jgi:hypothetical protein
MQIDYRRDFADIYAYVADRVCTFDPASHDGPGPPGPVKMIAVGFSYGDSGWVAVVFDTRPDAEPDGEWNSHIEGNVLERPHWQWEEGDLDEEEPITLIQADGITRVLPEEDVEVAKAIGELLKAVVVKARADGLFEGMPKAAGCELSVEHQDGHFGWPAYEDRGQDNLA